MTPAQSFSLYNNITHGVLWFGLKPTTHKYIHIEAVSLSLSLSLSHFFFLLSLNKNQSRGCEGGLADLLVLEKKKKKNCTHPSWYFFGGWRRCYVSFRGSHCIHKTSLVVPFNALRVSKLPFRLYYLYYTRIYLYVHSYFWGFVFFTLRWIETHYPTWLKSCN